jgi:predicted DNA-binding transcriptional regulator AlpA
MNDENPNARQVLSGQAARQYCGGFSRTTQYHREKDGTFPPGFQLGAYQRGWFVFELDAWNAAKARGASDDEMRALVKRIVARRKTIGTETEAHSLANSPRRAAPNRAKSAPIVAA